MFKKKEKTQLLIVGVPHLGRDVAVWYPKSNDKVTQELCKTIVRGSGRTVYLIEAIKIVGRFEPLTDEMPVKYTEGNPLKIKSKFEFDTSGGEFLF